jgi:DNA helicase-2/ATP-dependent DNA helicase PcrA
MKILLAGPGTGKTTNIKNIITEHGDGSKFLVLSYTNATVNDLQSNLRGCGVSEENCMTLHKFAVKFNHDKSRHILLKTEEKELRNISKGINIEFGDLCDFLSCTTFDQMIVRFVAYAKSNPLYLQDKLSGFDSMIVDEYQDFNPGEQSLIDVLLEKIETSYILGDDDQCIYDFKDASSDKIISFYQDANNDKLPHEHICYRCPDKVVEHATNLIKENKKRIDKRWLKNGNPGEIEYCQLGTFEDIADVVIAKIAEIPNENIFVLTPTEFAVQPLMDKLLNKKIEFTNCFTDKIPLELIVKSWEIRSIFGGFKYLNLVLLGYSILTDRKKYYKLLKKHYDSGENYDELFDLLEKKMPDRMKNNLKELEEFVSDEHYCDIKKLFEIAMGVTSIEKIENIFKVIEESEDKNIKIMSIYKSKGLGADYVFMVGLNEGILPNKQKGNDTLESQRRLFYVGVTRAKKQLYLFSNIYIKGSNIFANNLSRDDFKYTPRLRLYRAKASRFITELKLP